MGNLLISRDANYTMFRAKEIRYQTDGLTPPDALDRMPSLARGAEFVFS
jgi:hypothetical protein